MGEATVKCISVLQPWASFIMGDAPYWPTHLWGQVKDVENRTWSTGYRGDLLIHSSKGFDSSAMDGLSKAMERDYPRGVILGVVSLVAVVQDSESPWAAKGQFHWVLENPRRFATPVPLLGKLKLYDVAVSALGGQYGERNLTRPGAPSAMEMHGNTRNGEVIHG